MEYEMRDYASKCFELTHKIKSSRSPVCFDTLVVGSGPVAMLIADLRHGGESAFSYKDEQPCNAPLFFSMPGKPDQFKGHGSIVIGTGIQQSGLDFFGGNLEVLATEGIQRRGVTSKKATGESLSSALEKGREQLNMPIIGCWVDGIEHYSKHTNNWDATEDFPVRMRVRWPDGEQTYIYGRHIDLCLGTGPARHLNPKQMPEKQQAKALFDGRMCYLNETGFDAMAQHLKNKAAAAPDQPLRILLLNTHMSSSFITQLIENPETIFGTQRVPNIEITWIDRGENFKNFEHSSYPDDKYLYETYIKDGIDERVGHFLKKTDNTSLRIYTTKEDFTCSYSDTEELRAKWDGLSHAEDFDCFCLSLGQSQHHLHDQLVGEFGSFLPEFLYQGKLVELRDLPPEIIKSTNANATDTENESPSLIATHSPKGDVYSWGVSANTSLLGLVDELKKQCVVLNKKSRPYFAPNTHAPGSLAVVLSQLHEVYARAMLERSEFGRISTLRQSDPLWRLVKYKQQCRKQVLYYATANELGEAITKSVLKVLGYDDYRKEGVNKIYSEYYPKCLSIATDLLQKRAELINRDEFSVELITDRLLNEIFVDVPKELSEDPLKEFYEHFNRIYRYKTITEALLDYNAVKVDVLSGPLLPISDERKEIKQKLEKYFGAYRFGMNSVLDMNLLSIGEPRQHVISDHLPISVETLDSRNPSVKLISWNLLADVHLPNSFIGFKAEYLNAQALDIEDFGYYARRSSSETCDTYGLFFDLAKFITSHDFYKEESNYLRLIRPGSDDQEQISTEEFERVLGDWIEQKLDPKAVQWKEKISDEALKACRATLIRQIKDKGYLDSFKVSCVTACKLIKHIDSMEWQQRLELLSENKSLTDQLKQQDFITLQECTDPEAFLNRIFGEDWADNYGLLKAKASQERGGAYSDNLPGDFCVIIYKKSHWILDESSTSLFALGNNNKPGILSKFSPVDPSKSSALIVGSIHHPGGAAGKQITTVLSKLPDTTTPFIINGDFNHTKDTLSVPEGVELTSANSSLGTMAGNDWDGVHIGENIDLCMHSGNLSIQVKTVIPIDRTAERGIVTFQLYSKETEDGYNAKAALSEIENIKKIYARLAEEAIKTNRKPPLFELITVLIPHWDKEGNDFQHPDYLEKKKEYIANLESALMEVPVKVVDFTTPGIAEPDELEYIKGLKNYGIMADLMKNNAVIRHSNKPHIQMDTNTDILDFEKFYHDTIGQDVSNYRDALDVTCYNRYFLTVTNKVGFFAPESAVMSSDRHFVMHLKKARKDFFSQNSDGLLASKSRNAAYEEIFTVALERAGYVKRVKATHRLDAIDQFHANVTEEGTLPFFGITPDVAVVCRQTWQNKMGKESKGSGTERLESIPSLKYGDAKITSTHISFIIKRYTGMVALSLQDDHEQFLKIIDVNQDIGILTEYFMRIKKDYPSFYLDLLRVIPNIKQGMSLLTSMGKEYLNDRNKLVNMDTLIDEIHSIIKISVDKKIDIDRLKTIFVELQGDSSEIYLDQSTNKQLVEELLKGLNIISSGNGSIDRYSMENIIESLKKSIDKSPIDSRLSEITQMIMNKLEKSLDESLVRSKEICSKFRAELTLLKSAEAESPESESPESESRTTQSTKRGV